MATTTLFPFSKINSTSYCSIAPNDMHKCDLLIGFRKAMASLSFIGCLFVFTVIWLFKQYTSLAKKLLLYLTIAAFMECIAYFMGSIHLDGPACNFQGFYLTYFDWAVLLWVMCLTFNLFMNIVKERETDRYHVPYHLVCWGLPLIISCIPFSGDHYGPAGVWCWIRKEDRSWRFGIWYVPMFILLAIMTVTYIYLFYTLRQRAKRWEGTYDPDVERKKELLRSEVKVIIWYPLVYFAVVLFPLINRILDAADPDHSVFAIILLSVISAPLHGAANALVFGLDKETRSKLSRDQIKRAFELRWRRTEVRPYPDFSRARDLTDSEALILSSDSDF